MATQARAIIKIPARIVGAGDITVTLQNGIYTISSHKSGNTKEVNPQIGTTYTLVASDDNKILTFDNPSPITVTVPEGLGVGFSCEIIQLGLGSVTVVGSGASVNAFQDVFTLPGQYSVGWLYSYAPNAFVLSIGGGQAVVEIPVVYDRTTTFSGTSAMATTGPIGADLTTSAGVFDSTGKLVRTLWSAEVGNANRNDPEAAWDGTIDDGAVAPTGSYTIKVIAHDVQYEWDGAIGNSSPNHTTASYHAYGSVIRDMAITDAGEIYFTTVYDERVMTCRVMTTSDIQNSVTAFPPQGFRAAHIGAHTVCTDGTMAYFGMTSSATSSGVLATSCATHARIVFPSGTLTDSGALSWLGLNTSPAFAGQITGLAVQKTGSFIFLARPNLPGVQVYNKTSGAFVSTFTSLAHPRRLASNPTTITQLWVANDSDGDGKADTVVRCVVDGAGIITTSATTIACQDALALAISPDGTTLLIAEGGGVQQVKAYNTSDGSARSGWGTSGVLGTLGGYVNSPAVTNTKFMFFATSDMGSGGAQAFLAYQADGKFWIGDVGNCRYLRFSSGEAPAFVDKFSYIPGFYPCRVCRGDSTRVFANYLEFSVNYALPLSPTNGSWTLVNNWAGNLIGHASNTLIASATYNILKFVGVYSNGRTYGAVDLPTVAQRQIFELTSTGLRSTGWNIFPSGYLDSNMDLFFTSGALPGMTCTITKNAFTGFDGSGNPSWSVNDGTPGNTTAMDSGVTVLTSETLPTPFPHTHGYDNNMMQPVEALSNGVIPFFDPNTGYDPGWTNTHFGGIHGTTGLVKFSTALPMAPLGAGPGNYFLMYPPSGYVPYNISFGGGPILYVPGHSNVFVVFNGEEWGNNQTNMITHWHESGLALKDFGAVAPYFGAYSLRRPDLLDGDDIPADSPYSFLGLTGMAGNCRWGGISFVGGKYYIYQNDEWYHGGIGRWRVENLETISVTEYSVAWNSASYVPFSDPTDMLEGLTYNSVLVEGDSGWHRSGAEATGAAAFHIWTSVINPDRRHPGIGMQAAFFGDAVARTASRDLVRSGSGNWTLEGDIFMYPGTHHDPGGGSTSHGVIFFEVLDNTGKVIISWYSYIKDFSALPGGIKVNGVELFTIPGTWTTHNHTRVYVGAVKPFSIVANVGAGTMSFTYDTHNITVPGVLEVGAAIGSPTTMRLRYDAVGGAGEPATAITRLRFV